MESTSRPVVSPVPVKQHSFEDLVHTLWRELHTYNPEAWDADRARAWFETWLARVPSFGCSCQEHFRKLILEHPPDFSSREALFAWGIARHNDVNIKLGKKRMSLDDARSLYHRAA